jgi:hypothetical protein
VAARLLDSSTQFNSGKRYRCALFCGFFKRTLSLTLATISDLVNDMAGSGFVPARGRNNTSTPIHLGQNMAQLPVFVKRLEYQDNN